MITSAATLVRRDANSVALPAEKQEKEHTVIRNTTIVRAILVLTLGLTGVAVVSGQQAVPEVLSVREVVERVVESDPAIVNSRRVLEEAQIQYQLTLSGTRPNLSAEITPYQWDQRRPPASELVQTQSIGAGLSLQQALPTSGSLSAGISNETRFVTGAEDRVEQAPEVTMGLRQPLFVNGKLIGDDVYRARLRNADIGVERAVLNNQLVVNGNIQRALNLLVQVGSLRRSRTVLEETIQVLRRQLDSAEIDRQQGLISDNSLLSLQVTLNNRREALFDTEFALVQTEQNLARILGLPSLEGAELPSDLFSGSGVAQQASHSQNGTAVSDNPELGLQRLSVERTIRSGLLNELEDRPSFSVTVRMAPLYPASRDDPTAFDSSVSDFFSSDADVEATVALGLTVPLLTARERSYRERIDTLAQQRAETELQDTERAVANQMQTLMTNRRFLERRIEILQTDVEYERQRVENERALLQSGATTELRVDEVELDLLSRRNELWQIEAELFLNAVEILAVTGNDLAAVLLEQ
jgi:outer membrane protein TolC